MPAVPCSRQASVAAWFATEQGQCLESTQSSVLNERLAGRPNLPVLWVSPAAGFPRQLPNTPRLHVLHPAGETWSGALRCRLPFPLSSESYGTVIIQHPAAAGVRELVEECGRLLVPGGVLWLLIGAPGHPSRLLHPRHWLWEAPVGGWRECCSGAGLRLRASCRIGRPSLGLESASLLMDWEKRAPAPVGPVAVTRRVPGFAARNISTKVT